MKIIVKIWFLFVFSIPIMSADPFPSVPADAWQIKKEEGLGAGAIVLEKKIVFSSLFIEFQTRVRILEEYGKKAIEYNQFSSRFQDIEGQTSYPDGRTVPFTRKDFQNKTLAKKGFFQAEQTVMVPPGVTSDCIVDIRWRESRQFSGVHAMRLGLMDRWEISEPFPVKRTVIEIPKSFPWSWKLLPGPMKKSAKDETLNRFVLFLEGLPPAQEVPFSIEGDRKRTTLLLYPTPQPLFKVIDRGPEPFWNELGQVLVQDIMEYNITRGRPYKGLSEMLRKDAAGGPHEFAAELAKRMDGLIKNTSYLSREERAGMSKADSERRIRPKDLDDTAERRLTNATGMRHLFYEVLKDAGIKPKIALVADRNNWLFNSNILIYQQFDNILIGVEEAGKGVVWFDPGWRFSTPGLINGRYQGTAALAFDSSNWRGVPINLPVQPSAVNRRHADYVLELGQEEDQFKVSNSFTGLPERHLRAAFMPFEQNEQNRTLKESLEGDSSGITIVKAEVLNGTDPRNNLTWKAEGLIGRESGRRRVVKPFPVDPWPFRVPAKMDPTREEAIVLPYAFIHSATSTFQVPPGYQLVAPAAIKEHNELGSVSWTCDQDAKGGSGVFRVLLRIEVSRPIAPASSYEALKKFLEWMREACTRTLILDRVQSDQDGR